MIGYGEPLGDCRGQSAFAVLKVDRDKRRLALSKSGGTARPRQHASSAAPPALSWPGEGQSPRQSSIAAQASISASHSDDLAAAERLCPIREYYCKLQGTLQGKPQVFIDVQDFDNLGVVERDEQY